MHHMNSRGEDTRGDGPPLHKPRARLMMNGGSAGGLRRQSKVEDKPISYSPPVSKPHLNAQAVHANPPPRRSTSFSVKASNPVSRNTPSSDGSKVVLPSTREPHAGRPVRLALSGGHGGHQGSPRTSVATLTPVAAQAGNWESPRPLQQQQQQQQLFEGGSGEVSIPSVHTPRFTRSPDNTGKEPVQQRQDVPRDLFVSINGPDNSGGAHSSDATTAPSSFQQEGEEPDSDAYRRLLEQVGAERSARVRDLRSRVGELENHANEAFTEKVALEVHRHLDGATAHIAAAAVKDLEGRFPSAEVIQRLEERLPSAVAFSEVENRLAALERHASEDALRSKIMSDMQRAVAAADTRALEQLHAFRAECVELCRDICSDMLQQFEAQSEPRAVHRIHEQLQMGQEQLQMGLDQSVCAAESRLRYEIEAALSKLGSLEAAHGRHEIIVNSHKDQLKHLEAAHGHATALVHSHGSQLMSLKDAHSHHTRMMESQKTQLSDLEDRHASTVESHKQRISDLQAAHGHHANTLELLQDQDRHANSFESHNQHISDLQAAHGHHASTLESQVNMVRNLDQLVTQLSADMDVMRQQQQDTHSHHTKMMESHQAKLSDLEDRHASTVESHRQHISDLQDVHGHHASTLELLQHQDRHASAVESHKQHINDLQAAYGQHASTLESLQHQVNAVQTLDQLVARLSADMDGIRQQQQDAHTHHTNMMESHQARLSDLEDRHASAVESHRQRISDLQEVHGHHASTLELLQHQDRHANAVESHKQHITDLKAAHGHHANTLESLQHQVSALRNLDQSVARLAADIDVIQQQQQDSKRSPHEGQEFTLLSEQIDELRSKINELEICSTENAELHKSWKASHHELFQAHATRAAVLEDSHAQHRDDLETLRGQVESWQGLDEQMGCLLSDVEALKQRQPAESNNELNGRLEEHAVVVTLLKNDLQGMEKAVHNLVADMQALMERVPQAKQGHDFQESKNEGLQMVEKLEALTCLMSASREELDILRAQSAEGSDLRAELGALRLELSQANSAGTNLESLQAAVDRQDGAIEALVSQVSSIMSALDALKDRHPGDFASQDQDLRRQLEEHMAAFAGFRGELDVLKADVAASVASEASWQEADKDACRADEEGHGPHLAKAAETYATLGARLEALTVEFQADREARSGELARVWGALEQVRNLPHVAADPKADASADMTETLTIVEATPESIREGQVESLSSDEDSLQRQQLGTELHQKLEFGLERLRAELGVDLRRMELQFGQELPEQWNVIFGVHEKLITSIRGELEDIKAVQEQGQQAAEAAEEILCALEGAKEVIGLQEDHYKAAEISVLEEDESKGEAMTTAAITSLQCEVGSLKAAQALHSHDLKVLENAVTGHFGDMRAMFGHVEENVQLLHSKMDHNDTADVGHRISAMEQARQEDQIAVGVMMAEQRRHENLLTEAGACISRMCRFKDKVIVGSAKD